MSERFFSCGFALAASAARSSCFFLAIFARSFALVRAASATAFAWSTAFFSSTVSAEKEVTPDCRTIDGDGWRFARTDS